MQSSIRIGKGSKLVILHQTLGGEFNSVPNKYMMDFYRTLDSDALEIHLQAEYGDRGHQEGRDNAEALLDALGKGYSWSEIVVIVQEV